MIVFRVFSGSLPQMTEGSGCANGLSCWQLCEKEKGGQATFLAASGGKNKVSGPRCAARGGPTPSSPSLPWPSQRRTKLFRQSRMSPDPEETASGTVSMCSNLTPPADATPSGPFLAVDSSTRSRGRWGGRDLQFRPLGASRPTVPHSYFPAGNPR
jgi:hypothetical protein